MCSHTHIYIYKPYIYISYTHLLSRSQLLLQCAIPIEARICTRCQRLQLLGMSKSGAALDRVGNVICVRKIEGRGLQSRAKQGQEGLLVAQLEYEEDEKEEDQREGGGGREKREEEEDKEKVVIESDIS